MAQQRLNGRAWQRSPLYGARRLDFSTCLPALKLPQFLCIGAQKAGTSSLQDWLLQHPQVYLPPGKELHYFSLHHNRGLAWYGDQFAAARPDQRCGDITPYYLFHPLAAERIAAELGPVKVIVLLRDPVERCLSGLFHSIRLGLEPLPPAAALAAEAERLAGAEDALRRGGPPHHSHQVHSYLARSRYEQQLPRYEALFGADQLLILRSEELFGEPQRIWPRLLAFLGLEVAAPPQALPRSNAGGGEAAGVDPALRASLREALAPTYRQMAERYGLRWQAQPPPLG